MTPHFIYQAQAELIIISSNKSLRSPAFATINAIKFKTILIRIFMKHGCILLLLLSFVTLSSQSNAGVKELLEHQLNQQLADNARRYGVVGQSVLILKNNEIFYKGVHGLANIELDVKVNTQHRFPSYSVTKLITSVLMMKLVEKGEVKLNESILSYLPYLPQHWQAVTVAHLLNHTSGIPRYFDAVWESNSFLPNKRAVYESLKSNDEHFKIGTKNSYNNTNYLLLASILESKTGKSYSDLVSEQIVEPLKLSDLGHASANAVIKMMTSSYTGNNGLIERNRNFDWPAYSFSHSALYSSPEDLAMFMSTLVKGLFVSQKSLKSFWQPMKLTSGKNGRYAFGFKYVFEDNYYQLGHDGGNNVTLRYYFKDEKSTDTYILAYATNGNANGVWMDVLADSLMAIIDPNEFELAHLKEQSIKSILAKDKSILSKIYKQISTFYNNDHSKIESFLINRAYAVKYGVGVNPSIRAFQFILSKYPQSKDAKHGLSEAKKGLN